MSFLDKVKQAAEKAAEGAKKGTAQVKEKIELQQLHKKADEDAKQLGYLLVREREGTPAGEEKDRLIAEIQSLEAQIREADGEQAAAPAEVATADAGPGPAPAPAAPAPPAPAPPVPTSSSEPAPGDFKLE